MIRKSGTPRIRRARAARLLAALAVPVLLLTMPAVRADLPTDNTAPQITGVNLFGKEIAPGDQDVVARVEGRFLEAPASEPVVTANDPLVSFSVFGWSDTQIFVTVTADAAATLGAKTVNVDQELPGGSIASAGKANAFTVGLTPDITSVTPTSMDPDIETTVTISGTKFAPGATVTLHVPSEVQPTTTVVDSENQITATFAADPNRRLSNSATLRVTNTAGKQDQITFPVTGSAPTVSSLSVNRVGAGVSGVQATVTGSNFYTGVSVSSTGGVTFSGLTRDSRAQLTMNINVSDSAAPGSRDLVVTNGDGKSATLANALEVFPKPVIKPGQLFTLPQGAAGQVVVVEGSDFVDLEGDALTVEFLDADGNPTTDLWVTKQRVLEDGHLRLEVAAAETTNLEEQQQITLKVTNPGGASAECELRAGQRGGCFAVTPGPDVEAITPQVLTPGDKTKITITGKNFFVHGPLSTDGSRPGISVPVVSLVGSGIELASAVVWSGDTLQVDVRVTNAELGPWGVVVENPDGGRDTWSNYLTVPTS